MISPKESEIKSRDEKIFIPSEKKERRELKFPPLRVV